MKPSLVKNYLYNVGYQILVLVLPLITTPYISRVLGADGVGAFGYSDSITQYFILFGCIGLNLYGQREIAYHQGNQENRSRIFWELFIVRVVTVAIALVVFIFTVCRSEKYGELFTIQIVEVCAAMIDISWFFQGMEEFKKIVIRNVLVKIVGVALIFTLVKQASDLNIYTIIYVSTLFLGNMSMWIYLPKFINKVTLKGIRPTRHLKTAFILFIPQIATSIYTVLDKSMIGLLTKSDAEVAYYEQAQKIMKMALAVPTALGTVMLPRVANLFEEGKAGEIKQYLYKSLRVICFMTFPLCLGLCAIARGFVPWFFGEGFEKVADNLIVLAPIIIIVGISNIIGVQYLLPVGKQKQYTMSVVAGTVVNFTLNMVMIPHLLSIGAAIASIIAEISVTVFQMILVRREFSYRQALKGIYKYILAAVFMFGIVKLVAVWLNHGKIYETVIEIIIGVLVYGAALLVMRDDMLKNVIRKVLRRR